MFILFKEHRLNPERFINIEQLSKIGIEDIMGQSIPDFITVAYISKDNITFISDSKQLFNLTILYITIKLRISI